jgi:hypothetical protein
MIDGVDMYKKKEENVRCLLFVVLLAGSKRVTIIVAIVASKRVAPSKDKHKQRGKRRQLKYPSHNLTNTYF